MEHHLAQEIEARRQLANALRPLAEHTAPQAPTELSTVAARNVPPRAQTAPLAAAEAEQIHDSLAQISADRAMQTWQRRREAFLASPAGFRLEVLNPLRAELGDEMYERYLGSLGRSTSVLVGSVGEGSDAVAAGLQGGDRVTHYDGQRVFHLHELRALSVQGERGEYIHVQVLREGELVYLLLPRGPLGTSPVNTLG